MTLDDERNDRTLWLAVINQAILDGTPNLSPAAAAETLSSHQRIHRLRRDVARTWFNPSNSDFSEVCFLAGLDPEATSSVATAIFERCDQTLLAGKRFSLASDRSCRNTIDTRQGVGLEPAPSKGTGAGSTAQNSPNIDFSQEPAE